MIPLRDESPSRRIPWITILLILMNCGVFIYQLFIGPRGYEKYIQTFGLIPEQLIRSIRSPMGLFVPEVGFAPAKIFTAMFMHGGFAHLIGNMWYLWIFGDNVEDALGRFRFLLFYLFTGVLSFVAHMAATPNSALPLVGASGAIAGVLGAYMLLFPRHRILTLIPVFLFITTARIPSLFFLGLWFVMQLLYSRMGGNVAWWAHIGGFVAGFLLVKVFHPLRR